jgi:exopolysaccharide biosynthesis polyprenyl glycosylphosphotransferase
MKKNNKIILFLGDLAALSLSFFVSLRIGYLNEFNTNIYKTHIGPFLIIYTIWIILIFAFGLYEQENIRPNIRSIKNITVAFLLSFLISLGVFYLFPIFGISPKTNLLINISFFAIFFILIRRFLTSIFLQKNKEKILAIGETKELKEILQRIESDNHSYLKLEKHEKEISSTIWEEIKKGFFDIVIIDQEIMDKNLSDKEVENVIKSKTKFFDIVNAYEKILFKIPSEKINWSWFLTSVKDFRGFFYEKIKRIIEIIISIIGLVTLSPVLIIIFIAIKIEDGGNFTYSQTRVGKNGKDFLIHKIRSMKKDSEKDGPKWASEKDSRVTKVGKFVRSTHLDESLQLWNVIKGDVSFVGPRPERPIFTEELSKEIKNFNLRHIIKPGITGWAQINYKYGNSIEDSKQKFEYDLYYIKNRNIFLDLNIILRTIKTIFFS